MPETTTVMGKGYVDGAGGNYPANEPGIIACSIRHRTFYFLGCPKFEEGKPATNTQVQNP
jgi:hypothetical protein